MKHKKKYIAGGILVLIALLIFVFYYKNQQSDTAKPETHTAQSSSKLEAPEGGGAVSLTYTKQVNISLADQKAELLFQNPEKSVNELSFRLVITDEAGAKQVLAQSEVLLPGDKVTEMAVANTDQLTPGNYEAQYELTFYDEDHNEISAINGVVDSINVVVS